jgi:hypothetical protein
VPTEDWFSAGTLRQLVRSLRRRGRLGVWAARDLLPFFADLRSYLAAEKNPNFLLSGRDLEPYLDDRTQLTPVEPTYFFQDSWAARKLFGLKPARLVDVGSSAKTIGILSQFVPTTMVDIRPLEVELDGLSFVRGSILQLPFDDESVECLSSLCVVEHIGLGRYGDAIDPWGSEKAVGELQRVLRPGGHLLVSVPVDTESRVYFNAHRTFTPSHVASLFAPLRLLEERYIYGSGLFDAYAPSRGFGTGLFHWQKPH